MGEMGIHPIEGGGGTNGLCTLMPEVSRGWDQAHLCSIGLKSIIISNCNSYILCTSIIHLLLLMSFFSPMNKFEVGPATAGGGVVGRTPRENIFSL